MAASKSKTILILLITNFIVAQTQDSLTSEEIKSFKESDELPETTALIEEEGELSTTTEFNITDEELENRNAEPDTVEAVTDEANGDTTGSSANNVVDESENTVHSNLSNNIDVVSKVSEKQLDFNKACIDDSL